LVLLILAVILSSIFILWRWGKEQQWTAEAKDGISPAQLLQLSRVPSSAQGEGSANAGQERSRLTLQPAFGGGEISTASGVGIFFGKVDGAANDATPKGFTQFIRKLKARPDVVIFFFHTRDSSHREYVMDPSTGRQMAGVLMRTWTSARMAAASPEWGPARGRTGPGTSPQATTVVVMREVGHMDSLLRLRMLVSRRPPMKSVLKAASRLKKTESAADASPARGNKARRWEINMVCVAKGLWTLNVGGPI
jgi:hypothetical protein